MLLIHELNLEEKVLIKGKTRKINEVYFNSSIFVTCSEMEGFGLTVAEALSAGVPVVAIRNSGLDHLIKDRFNGLLVER